VSGQTRAVWMLAGGILVAGWFFVHDRFETAILQSRSRTDLLYRQTVANSEIVRQASMLREVQRRAETDLAQVSRDASPSATTARLLQMLHDSASSLGSQILSVEPGAPQPGGAALQATQLTIRIRGRFQNVLRFVEDLSHHGTLVRVSDTEMVPAHAERLQGSEPRLDATIHAILYRLLPVSKELHLASAR